jgi:molybdenum cofactor cytidylyltransferase
MAKIAGIILGAGLSSRMGEFKLLLPWKDDNPIIWHLVEMLKSLPLEPLILVTGHRAEELKKLFSESPIQLVHNPDYAEGEILSSFKIAMTALPADVDAVLVFLGDMPLISLKTVQTLIDSYQAEKIIIPHYQENPGHPRMFTKRFFGELLALEAPAQPRALLQSNPDALVVLEVEDEGILIDIDTPDDYKKHQA